AGRICRVSEPANFWDRHLRNADSSTALLDLFDGLIKRLDRNGVSRARTLTFTWPGHPAVDSRLFVITGCNQPILDRTAFEFVELPAEDVLVKRLYRLWVIRVNFKVSYTIHFFAPSLERGSIFLVKAAPNPSNRYAATM